MKKLIKHQSGKLRSVTKGQNESLIIKTDRLPHGVTMTKMYFRTMSAVHSRAEKLIGHDVIVSTSQESNSWSSLKWFSDVEPIQEQDVEN